MELHTQVKGTGYPILCLHGHPGSGQTMGVFTERLASRYQIIAPDLRGYGKSRATEKFELVDHIADLVATMDAQGIHQCFVLGWSLGGILAMELALRYPHRIQGLVLVGTAARPAGNHPPVTWIDLAYTGIASVVNFLVPGQPWVIDHLGKKSLYRFLIRQHTPTAYRRLAAEGAPAYLRTSRLAHQALNRALKQRYNRLADLSALTIPSLMLCGAEDCHITADASRETARYLPQSEIRCYPETAHLFPWEIPELTLNDISTWLEHHVPKTYA